MGLRERLTTSAADIRARSQRLVELNVELLTTELKRKGRRYGSALGMLVVAGVLALYALGLALATIVVALALVVPLWLALLIVTAVLLVVVMILALAGRGQLRRAKTPAPERAIAEAKATVDTLKSNLQQTASDLTPRRAGGSPPGDATTPTPPATAPTAPPTTSPGASTPTTPDMPHSNDEVR